MLISAAVDDAKTRESIHLVDDQPYVGREYIGSSPKPGSASYGKDVAGDGSPQAYLVMQPANSVTRPHFHLTNQFQVFVGGGGRVGKLRVDPVTVQYAGANTPYGPILAGDAGIDYFTLRQEWDSGAKYLPAERDRLVKGRQRQVVGSTTGGGVPGEGVREEALFAPQADGLLALSLRLAPGVSTPLPDSGAGGGQYHVVLAGALARGGEELGPHSVEFASHDEGPVEIGAGPRGLELLLLRFPRRKTVVSRAG